MQTQITRLNERLEKQQSELNESISKLEERQRVHALEMKELMKCLHSYESEIAKLKSRGKETIKNISKPEQESQTSIMPLEVARDQVEVGSLVRTSAGCGTICEGKVKVALKQLQLSKPSQTQLLDRLKRKIPLLVLVRHANIQTLIAAVFDLEGNKNPPYIITEIPTGINLHVTYEQERLSAKQQLSVFKDVAKALEYLHDCDMMHGDINSDNVLLTKQPHGLYQAKVSDLGSSKFARESLTILKSESSVYHAPEISSEKDPCCTEDVYSYGIVLCEVIAAQFPDKKKLPSMIQQVTSLWLEMLPLVISCIEHDPDIRPLMADILSTLETITTRS